METMFFFLLLLQYMKLLNDTKCFQPFDATPMCWVCSCNEMRKIVGNKVTTVYVVFCSLVFFSLRILTLYIFRYRNLYYQNFGIGHKVIANKDRRLL